MSESDPTPDFRLLFEAAPGLYLVLTTDLRIVAVTEGYLRATMTRREDILGRSIFDVFPDNPADPEATGVRNLRDSLERVVRTRETDAMAVQKYDVRRPDSDGGEFEVRYWSPVNSPVLGDDGGVAFIIHRVEDVTEFVRLKERESEHVRLTEALRSRSGRMEAEILRRSRQLQDANFALREVQASLELRVDERTAELARLNAALKEEMEQSKRLEEQFRQAQKMEAIATLAGGLAHDFNNLLTVVSGYSSLLLDDLPAADSMRIPVEEISKASDRAASLTRQLLAFSRQQVLDIKPVDINAVVKETTAMLARLIGEDIILTTMVQAGLGPVLADEGQLGQVIVNLAVNARDAMPNGGSLTIETSDIVLDEAFARDHVGARPGRHVVLTVADTGHGIDDATKKRIFEPFFTTKERGKGTGLGLATVFGIVEQLGGHVSVESEPGRGATFRIYLPASDGKVRTEREPGRRAIAMGTETVLLVEDEPAVRVFTGHALRALGYTVLEAPNGASALATCRTHPGPIHLLLSDVVMPGMGGRQVADAVLAMRPETRVLFLSGYTDDAVVQHGILHEHVAFLQKPFTPSALAEKIRDVLGR